LHEHYRQLHRNDDSTAVQQPVSEDSHYKNLAEAAVNSIRSNNDREEASRFLAKSGAWGWDVVYRQIMTFIQRRTQQRSMAGR